MRYEISGKQKFGIAVKAASFPVKLIYKEKWEERGGRRGEGGEGMGRRGGERGWEGDRNMRKQGGREEGEERGRIGRRGVRGNGEKIRKREEGKTKHLL